MFTMDVPYVPAQETPIVLAQADTPAGSAPQPDYILKDCQDTSSSVLDAGSAVRGIYPAGSLALFYSKHRNQIIDTAKIKTTLLEGTKHGELAEKIADNGAMYYMYDPTPDYVGDDQAVFMVEFAGIRYKLVVTLKVEISVDNNGLCPLDAYELIKVNKPSSGSLGYEFGYSMDSITVNLADLAGAALGQTTGSTITLDNNAAGATTGSSTPPLLTTANSSPLRTPTSGWRKRVVLPTAR